MVNIPPIKPSTEVKTQRLPDITKTWQVGQLLNATAETGGDVMSRVVLRIGQLLFEARTPIPIKTGEQVQLVIKSIGEQPVFNIQKPQDLGVQATDKLKSLIARQGDIKTLLQQLPRLMAHEQLPTDTRQLLQSLSRLQATPKELSQPSQLKTWIQRSGYFHEPLLTNNPGQSQLDLKAQLLTLTSKITEQIPRLPKDVKLSEPQTISRAIQQFIHGSLSPQQLSLVLSSRLPPAQLNAIIEHLNPNSIQASLSPLPTDLQMLINHLQQSRSDPTLKETLFSLLRRLPVLLETRSAVETALARLTSQQLLPMTREGENPLLWLIDIPVKDKQENQLLQLRIEQEQASSSDNVDNWSVSLTLEFVTLGLIQARIHLVADTLATVFHAEKKHTEQLIQQNLPLLESALLKHGFSNINLDISSTRLSPEKTIPENIHFVDEKA